MPDPQAIATHEGLRILSLNFTLSRGVQPSACYAEAIPEPTYSGSPGTLKLTYGDFKREFTGCAVDHSDLRIERGRRVNLRILDRRWQWQHVIVTYRANLQLANGTIRSDTQRTPKQIADMLFGLLGESGVDTNDLPSNVYPFVEWDGCKVVDALEELCGICGCVVVPEINDKFSIRKIGVGGNLPPHAVRLSDFYPVQSAALPKNIQVRTDEAIVQSKFLLRAITTEFSGDQVTLGRASYYPTNGWEYETPYAFYNVGGLFTDRDFNIQYGSSYALEHVWRLFEIWTQAPGSLGVPGMTDPITSMEQLTFGDTLNDFGYDMNSVQRACPAYVEGIFWTGCDNYANTILGTRYHGKFTIDSDRGYVIFDEPVFSLASDYTHANPLLYLTTTYTVRPNLLSTPNRYQFTRSINGNGKGTYGVDRRDLVPRIAQRYTSSIVPSGLDTNLGQMDNALNAHLNAIEESCKPQPAQDGWYGGWLNQKLDGTIAQITWTAGLPGKGTMTRITRWNQHWPTLGGIHAT